MKQALWKAIEAYRQSTSIEDQWRNRDALDTLINAALSLAEFDAAPVQAVVKDSLTTQEPTPLEVRLVDTLLGQAQEPFAPDWAGYRQGKADGIAEAQERKPLPHVPQPLKDKDRK